MIFKFVHFLRFLTRKTYSITNEKGFFLGLGKFHPQMQLNLHTTSVVQSLASIVNERYGLIIKFSTSFPSHYNVKPSPYEPHYGSTSTFGLPLLRGHVELVWQL
jgi:hypothetical protein